LAQRPFVLKRNKKNQIEVENQNAGGSYQLENIENITF